MTRGLMTAALVSACAALWTGAGAAADVAAVQADTASALAADAPASAEDGKRLPSPFLLHMQEAHRYIAEKRWPEATEAARLALAAARQGENSYEEFDAVATVINLLHKQQRYTDARLAAEAQIAIFDKRDASQDAISQLLTMAIREGAAAGESAEVSRLQERVYAQGNAYPGQWNRDGAARRLDYVLADMSLPLSVGGWALVGFKPANQRMASAQLNYVQTLPDGATMSARVWIAYREDQRAKSPETRREELARRMGERESDQTLAPDVEAELPPLVFPDVIVAKRALQEDAPSGVAIDAEWIALRGDWYLYMQASFPQANREQAIAQLRPLFDAVGWKRDVRLFRDKTMMAQDQDIDSYWSMARDWQQAAALAQAALPDAAFPLEIARINTVLGQAAFERGELAAARRDLDRALAAWAHADKAYQDERLYQTALDTAADIAYRQGRTQDAVALNKQFIGWVGGPVSAWAPSDGGAQIKSEVTGMSLPLRVGEFRLEPIDEKRFYYRNLMTGEQLGLAVEQNAAVPDERLESSMRSFIEDNLGLRISGVKTAEFSPKAQAGMSGDLRGRKWIFQVEGRPDDGRAIHLGTDSGVAAAPPDQMVFWVVDRGSSRSILRAPLPADAEKSGAGNFAEMLAW